MASSTVRGVVFDLVGTLIHPARRVANVYHDFGSRFGSQLSTEEISARFHEAFASANWTDASHGSQRETWRGIVSDVFQLPQARNELFAALWSHFADPSAWRVYDDVMPTLAALRQRHLALAIGSNFDDRVRAICRGLGLNDAVDQVFWSSQLGHSKPALQFFQSIADRLRLEPSALLMVGDRPEHDVDPPRLAGWRALHLVRRGGRPLTAGLISDLHELVDRFD